MSRYTSSAREDDYKRERHSDDEPDRADRDGAHSRRRDLHVRRRDSLPKTSWRDAHEHEHMDHGDKQDTKRKHSREKSPSSTHKKKKSSSSSSKKRHSTRKYSDDTDTSSTDASTERRRKKEISKKEYKKLKQEYELQKESQVAAQIANNLGYSNTDNPFNDTTLSHKFVWYKKRELEAKQGISSEERGMKESHSRKEKEAELERLNKRRAEREIETQLREQEQLRMARDAERAQLGDWDDRENEFHLQQAKTRAQIRIKEGRAKAIDVLAMNISLTSGNPELAAEFDALGLEPDEAEPYHIFDNLSLREVEELHNDIQLYLELEKDPTNQAFWQAMMVVCDDELAKKGTKHANRNLHEGTAKDINAMLNEKTPTQLSELQRKVEETLAGGGSIDVEYWEAVLKSIIVARSKSKLKEMHQTMLEKRYAQLLQRAREQADEIKAMTMNKRTLRDAIIKENPIAAPKNESQDNKHDDITQEAVPEEIIEEYDPRMSPPPMPELSRDDRQLPIYAPDDDLRELQQARERVIENREKLSAAVTASTDNKQKALPLSSVLKMGQNAPSSTGLAPMTAEDLFVAKASEAMEAGEVIFGKKTGEEVDLSTGSTYTWQDKYRPRKPRYFNRVQTGYEWNKYNQTHYDPDNPPPKIVQGYKFNIFYPDLIDGGQAPTFKIERDAGWPETCIIKFLAGPPYEDIAFRIVNKEWERSHKKGFKSSFDRGVLQLHFNFRRTFYRR
ncbi:hypothetical protein SeLEV6574_g05200 [Synchytrium endobioticum]|nr:hypothetical protein SeLEV6574_g05200 [Synchytrium endobioticum]